MAMEKRRFGATVLCAALAGLILAGDVLASGDDEERGSGKKPEITKVTFIHFRRGHGGPALAANDELPNEGPPLYRFIWKGARWRWTETFCFNAAGGPDAGLVHSALADGLAAWDNEVDFPIFGELAPHDDVAYNGEFMDDVNAISFGWLDNPGIIAMCSVWIAGSKPSTREIVEADIVFNTNTTYFTWGDADEDLTVMDLQNIATHEIGHAAGMGDLYNDATIEQTMHGYSTIGETDKRTLEPDGDIPGIVELYK